MKVEVVMPKMGESLQEGTILKWLKNVGEIVERDEMILEISTDKVDTEVPSPVKGKLIEILAQENETVEVGKTIAYIETDSNAAVEAPKAPAKSEETAPKAEAKVATVAEKQTTGGNLTDVVMPKMGESLQEGTIIKWLKQVGEKVERDEMILEISTDKVDTEVPSPVSGVLSEILAQENETVEVGKVIARIAASGGAPATAAQAATPAAPTPAAPTPSPVQQAPANATYEIPARDGDNFYSPLVRTIAEQEKVSLQELQSIQGTGADGRINKNDIIEYVNKRNSGRGNATPAPKPVIQHNTYTAPPAPTPKPAPQPAEPAKTAVSYGTTVGDTEIIPMDRVRTLISQHMVHSVHTSPHVTSVGEADVTEIVKYRNKNKNLFEQSEGIKLTFTPFFAKAAIEALKQYPMVNVSVDGTNIIRHKKINLSFATALEDGNLIVPVIKNADQLNLTGIAHQVNDLSTRARSKKLNPDEIQGGTFTITNVGTFGTLFGTPIINQPQVAIMGIGAIQKRPVVKDLNGEPVIVIRDMAYVSLTYDHRVIDGQLAGQCLAAIIKSLEAMNDKTL